MQNTIDTPAFTETMAAPAMRAVIPDHDIREIAIGFGRQAAKRPTDFGTTTMGDVTFRRVDPLREPLKVADERLQVRLEALCEILRAKY